MLIKFELKLMRELFSEHWVVLLVLLLGCLDQSHSLLGCSCLTCFSVGHTVSYVPYNHSWVGGSPESGPRMSYLKTYYSP